MKNCDHYTLDNGTPVYAVNAGTQEVLLIELVFFAGNWYEQQNIVAATTNFMLKNGTRQRSAFDINEHFEFYGAYLNRHCHNEIASLTLHCLNKHVNELLHVIGELLRRVRHLQTKPKAAPAGKPEEMRFCCQPPDR